VLSLDERALAVTRDVLAGKNTLPEALNTLAEGLGDSLLNDLRDPLLYRQWGFCQAQVVPRKVLEIFAALSGLDYSESCAPSGVVHTYGYLLSTEDLPLHLTKRHRWTSGAISRFFGDTNSLFLSETTTFLRFLTEALQTLPGIGSELVPSAPHTRQFSEVGRFEEHCTDHRWHSRWQVFENGTSATREHESSEEAHLLVYQVGLLEGPLKLITAFPVRRERVDALTRDHELDGPRLRFNACIPSSTE